MRPVSNFPTFPAFRSFTNVSACAVAFALAVSPALLPGASPRAEPPAHSSWKLAFFDEFEGTALDAAKWSNGYALEKTGPDSWPDPANVRIGSGSLKLYGEKRAGQGKNHAGAAITTKGKFKHMYGYIEARIKVPNGKGFSAKMTATKADGGYPPWLDIIETRGEEVNHPYWILHAGGKEAGGGWNGTNLVTEYHTLATEWTADEFLFYVDGVVKLRDKTLAPLCRMEMCWAMELMVGGSSWIGIPDASTPWPGVYEIDYVRIYSRLGPPTAVRSAVKSAVKEARPQRAAQASPAAPSWRVVPGGLERLANGRWISGRPE